MSGKTLQFDIIERFLTPEQVSSFMESYNASRKGKRAGNRFDIITAPITDQEKSILNDYINATDQNVGILAKKYNMPTYRLVYLARIAALKTVLVNKSILGF